MVCLSKLIEDCVSRSNALISFKINVPRRGSVQSKDLKDVPLVQENQSDPDDLETSYYTSDEYKDEVPEMEVEKQDPLELIKEMKKNIGKPQTSVKAKSRISLVKLLQSQ